MAWTKVNDATATGTTDPVSTPAFTNPLTPGSIIIVGISRNLPTINTPTDTAGNTYIDCGAGLVLLNSSANSVQIFYALNTFSTASNVISLVNPSGAGPRVTVVEFTGNASSNPVDVTAVNPNASTGTGGGQNMTSTAAVTTVDGDLIIGRENFSGGTVTIGTNFSNVLTSPTSPGMEYLIQASQGSIAATWSNNTNSQPYGAIMAAFKAGGAAGDTIALTAKFNLNIH